MRLTQQKLESEIRYEVLDTCQWDQFVTGFGLFVLFIDSNNSDYHKLFFNAGLSAAECELTNS